MSGDFQAEGSESTALVAGATGTAGTAYLRELVAAGYRVLGTVRPGSDASAIEETGASPVEVDLRNGSDTRDALLEVDAVLVALLGRGDDAAADEREISKNVIDAARARSIGHVVYTSVHRADQQSGVPHFEVKGEIEAYLEAAGLTYTILRPTTFMDALSAPWLQRSVREDGILASPIHLDTPITYLDTADLATVGRLALETKELQNTTLPIAGPAPVTYRDLLPVLDQLFGFGVTYQQIPLEQAETNMGSEVAAMVRHFNENGFVVENSPLLDSLSLELTTVEEYVTATWSNAPSPA